MPLPSWPRTPERCWTRSPGRSRPSWSVGASDIRGIFLHFAVIIPARNEAENLGPLLADVWRQHPDVVVVADNGSSDGTAEVAARHGATVVSEPRAGYGYACAA